MSQESTGPATVMVVDDTPANLALLDGMLTDQGYRVRSFPRGRLALAAAKSSPPDIILLDINMPEMDGFELCGLLKAEPTTAEIPVLFISALNELADKVKAFEAGGVDYITKPFQFAEVQARLTTHLRLRALQLELAQHNRHLDDLVRKRTRQLAEAHARLGILDEAKTEFLHLIAHELRTPLTGVLGCADFAFDEGPQTADMKELRQAFSLSKQRLLETVDNALLLAEVQVTAPGFGRAALELPLILARGGQSVFEFAVANGVMLGPRPTTSVTVHGDEQLLSRAIGDLLKTAVALSERGETVVTTVNLVGENVEVVIDAVGHTIDPLILPHFLEVFTTRRSETRAETVGLAPAAAARIAALHGGTLTVANTKPAGVKLTLTLPLGGPQ